jgi:hypothetical protein
MKRELERLVVAGQGAEVEEAQPVDHSSRLDFLQGPGMVRVVINRNASLLKQQRDELQNLGGADNPPGYVNPDGPGRAMADSRFEDRHLIGLPIGEEVAVLVIVDGDVKGFRHDPRIALLRQVLIE